jgi:hypothetical protein
VRVLPAYDFPQSFPMRMGIFVEPRRAPVSVAMGANNPRWSVPPGPMMVCIRDDLDPNCTKLSLEFGSIPIYVSVVQRFLATSPAWEHAAVWQDETFCHGRGIGGWGHIGNQPDDGFGEARFWIE